LTSVRIKICGITRLEDAKRAVSLGVDALGFVFFAGSPRYVEPVVAADIIRELPPFVTKVGLFVNAATDQVKEILETTRIDFVQYHGDETPSLCAESPRAWMKAIRVKDGMDLAGEISRYRDASAIFLDAYDENMYGGTGRQVDWKVIPKGLPNPVILAGGLTADNVEHAINVARPYAVDVSSGIEASEGIKDAVKMRQFVEKVRRLES